MKLNINKIAITGFRGYKERVEYQLGDRTIINGDNGLGKSSIGEAIVWAITGCDMWGNEKSTTKLVNDSGVKLTEVSLECVLDGQVINITRRKKGSSNDLYVNEVKTRDLGELYKSKNLFLSIFNPYYFPELAPKDAKQLLSDCLKPVSKEEVFQELGDYLVDVLKKNNFNIPETFLNDVRTDLKEQQDNLIFLEGAASKLQMLEVPEKKNFDDTELKQLKEELAKLYINIDIESEIAKIVPLKDFDSDLKQLKVEEQVAKMMVNNLALQSPITVNYLIEQKNELLTSYKYKKNTLDTMERKIVKCEKCGYETDLTAESRELLQAELKNIQVEGLKLKSRIEQIQKSNKEIEEKNLKIREEAENKVAGKLAEIENKRVEILKSKEFDEVRYRKEREEVLLHVEAAKAQNADKQKELATKIGYLEAERMNVIEHNSRVDAVIAQNAKCEADKARNTEDVQNCKNKINQLKLAIDAGKQYNSIKLKKQAESINKYLDRVSIQFEKMTKDGELKDDFKVLLDGKEFSKLSGSEKIRAGLEIANLLMNIQDMYIPVFVDDGERINAIPELNTQMIVTKVTMDKEINVEVK